MKLDIKKDYIEKLYEAGRYDKLIEIMKSCGETNERVMTEYIINNNVRDLTEYILGLIYKVNREKELSEYVPLKARKALFDKKQIKEYKDAWNEHITDKAYSELLRLTEGIVYDENVFGILKTDITVPDYYLEDGILFDDFPLKVTDQVEIVNNFDFMLKEIVEIPSYYRKPGCFLVKIPKNGLIDNFSNDLKNKIPIFYRSNKQIYLNPEYILCYIPVDMDTSRILRPILKTNYKRIPSIVYEGDDEGVKRPYIKTL